MILDHTRMGVGTWAWGDYPVWEFDKSRDEAQLADVFRRCVQDGVCYFACSEGFAEGTAERILGQLLPTTAVPVIVSTKFTPRLWRFGRGAFLRALRGSMTRLGLTRLDLYSFLPPVGRTSIQNLAEYAAEALDLGLTREVGVSNFSARQMDTFNEHLGRFGYSISCLETEYNLLARQIESNGVMDICRQLRIPITAQNPLAMGYLSGRFDPNVPSEGTRGRLMRRYATPYFELLLRNMNNVAMENDGKSVAQVALNWLLCKGVIPIPGTRRVYQAIENNMTPHWQMKSEHVALLDEVSLRVKNL